MACLDSRVWSGHKKIIVSDPDIYDQPGQVPPWWCGAPSSSDVTLATSFYHQPVFMFMGNSQILPQITVWRPINFCSNIWVGWKLPPSHICMDHKTWATSFTNQNKIFIYNNNSTCPACVIHIELISKLYIFTDKKIPRLTLLAHLGIFWTKSFISCHLS